MRKESNSFDEIAGTAFEFDRYAPHLKETDALSEAQKRALLEVLFEIMKQFVALGFDVSALPLDIEPDECGYDKKERDVSTQPGAPVVQLSDNPSVPEATKDHRNYRKEA